MCEGARGRGVCFVREFVPSTIVSLAARVFYNEPYEAKALRSAVARVGGCLSLRHTCPGASGVHSLAMTALGTV